MTDNRRNHRRPFRLAHLLLLALFIASFAAISCQQVSDVAGVVSLDKSSIDKCIQDCNKLANKLTHDQTQIHRVVLFLCHGNQQCIHQENARFQAAIAAIEANRHACIQGCQHQGGASGGR